VVDPIPIVNISGPTGICEGPAVTLNATGASTYIWSNGFMTDSITFFPDQDTTLSVIGYNSNGCESPPAFHTIQVTPNHYVYISSVDSLYICVGESRNLDAFSTSTNASLQYYWSSNYGMTDTTAVPTLQVSPVTTTVYYVQINDNGCNSPMDSALVTVSNLRADIYQITDASCPGMNDGSAVVSASGGIPFFTYLWDDSLSQTTLAATGLSAGTYILLVTDSINCTSRDTIIINEPPPAFASITGTDTICYNTATTGLPINVSLSGTSPWSIIYTDGNNIDTVTSIISSSYAFDSDTLIASTTYTLISVLDSFGCLGTVSNSANIMVTPLAMVDAGIDSVICFNDSIGLNASLINATSGSWITGNGTYSPDSTSSSAVYTPSTGEQSVGNVALVWQNNNGCGTNKDTMLLTITPFAIANAGADQTICSYEVVNLSAGLTYSTSGEWSGGSGTFGNQTDSNTIYTPAPAEIGSTINLMWKSTDGCGVDSDMVSIYINPLLMIDAGADSAIMCDNKVNLLATAGGGTGSGTYLYQWAGGPVTAAYDSVGSGTYFITITDSFGCIAADSVTISYLNSTLAIALSPDTSICNGDLITVYVNASGGSLSYSYSWNNGSTVDSIIVGGGNWTIEVTDGLNCSVNETMTITENAVLNADAGIDQNIFCAQTINLTASATGGDGSYTYQWEAGPATSNWDSLGAGTYIITVTDGIGCIDTDSVNVAYANSNLNVNITSDTTICFGQTMSVTAQGTGGTGQGTYNYTWNTNETTDNITVGAGSWTVIVADAFGCTYTKTMTISYLPPLAIFGYSDTSFCPGGNATLSALASGGNGNYYYAWYENGIPIGNGNTLNVSPDNTSTYSVTVTDSCSISSASDALTITVHDISDPLINAVPNPTTIDDPVVKFNGSSSTVGGTYFWDFGDGGPTSNLSNPTHEYQDTGTFTVTLIMTNSSTGCQDSITYQVIIEDIYSFFVPNAFSPNGDGLNDGFIWVGYGIVDFQMYIFNRWGEMIYKTDNYGAPWNGRRDNKGPLSQDGVYIWLIEVKDFKNKFHRYTGYVTLLKY
ncbi:gliding motility-associated C-terminal domain-containing protein, partial [Candidatus Amoebophilus asiaticus]|nr:gliding motility-associated C-terminal domain-containing protein [Candidatus Amoebophilus asiaticus]